MPVLPSGRVVSIMSERARYHAARLKLRITEATPHRDLYPLIDILIEKARGSGSGSTLGFSGHTVGDGKLINGWDERDRHFFLDWLREPAQVSTIELARRRLLLERGTPKERVFPYPARLYSVLQRRVMALPLRKASAAQWKRTLLNMLHDGVRRDELEWSGVLVYLDNQHRDTELNKESVVGAIDFSPIELKLSCELECKRECQLPFREVAQRQAAYQLQLAGYLLDDDDIGVIRLCARHHNYRIGVVWPGGHPPRDQQQWFVLGPYAQPVADAADKGHLFYATREAAQQSANLHALRNHHARCELVERTRYEYMTLHGGEEYREWLVTLPHYHPSLFNGHFHERNILLHMRTKVRHASDGSRVLFIEELQSDWHQVSERSRRFEEIPPAPFRREWVTLAAKLLLLHVVERGLDGIAWADAQVHEMRYDKPLAPLRRLYDEALPRTLLQLGKPWQLSLAIGGFATRSPWLHAARHKDRWRVEGGAGRFFTRARFDQQQAVALITRHSKAMTLDLPLLRLPAAMRAHIAQHGLPLFGEAYQ